jgi:peptidylprolyl isomerase
VLFRSRRLAALLVVPAIMLTACSSNSKSGSPSGSSSATGGKTAAVGVKVSGAFGATPTVTVPAKAPPATLTQQIISQGAGAAVAKGDTLVANYVGETWAPKNGKVDVFDSSFTRGTPAAFVIGVGKVIAGWDKTLVGKKLGTRVLLTVPPADGYGAGGQSSAGITGRLHAERVRPGKAGEQAARHRPAQDHQCARQETADHQHRGRQGPHEADLHFARHR